MRKFLTYTLLILLIAGLFFLFWDSLSSFWKKSSIIAALTTGFFMIKDFIFWAFHFLLKRFSSLFKYFIAILASIGVFFCGYNSLPENGSVKNNITEMQHSIGNFFKLPTRNTNIDEEGVIMIPSTRESERTLGNENITSEEGERIQIYTDASSSEGERKLAMAQNNESDNKNSIDPLTAILSNSESDTEENSNSNTDESVESLLNIVSSTDNSADENSQESDNQNEENNENNKNNNSDENNADTEVLSFTNDSEKNWKTPVIQIINTPDPTEAIVIATETTPPQVTAVSSADISSTASPTPSASSNPLAQSGGNLPSSGNSTDRFTIMFRESPVQVVYPVEYALSNAVWTDSDDNIDSVSFTVTTPKKVKAKMNITIFDSGKLFEKYAPKFTEPASSTENIFFIEKSSSNSVEYITFFNGNCWKITISLPTKNPSLEDFYNILLPAVFEAQE